MLSIDVSVETIILLSLLTLERVFSAITFFASRFVVILLIFSDQSLEAIESETRFMDRDLTSVSFFDLDIGLHLVCYIHVGVRLFEDLVSTIRQGFEVDKVVVSLDFVERLEVMFVVAGFSMETVAVFVELFAFLRLKLSSFSLGV